MAKTKKSRRVRRQEAEKQRRSAFDVAKKREAASPSAPATSLGRAAEVTEPALESRVQANRKKIDFVQEYFYVYRDLKSILIVAALMFAVLVGLSFVI